jgi:hypothetical protein
MSLKSAKLVQMLWTRVLYESVKISRVMALALELRARNHKSNIWAPNTSNPAYLFLLSSPSLPDTVHYNTRDI